MTVRQTAYTEQFYADRADESLRSAREIVPLVMDWIRPQSVLDVGCGTGGWLRAFSEAGVSEVQGVDGDYVQRSALQIPPECFMPHDLRRPLALDRRFDLVMSVEVAEHLEAGYADQFVASLVAHGAVVLFSAAIPFQGGTGHVNEQWPDYWAERFGRHGYVPVDAVRPRVWRNERVTYWYRQNVLLFAHAEALERFDSLRAERAATRDAQLSLVHPEAYRQGVDYAVWPFAKIRSALPELARQGARRVLGKLGRR